MEVVQNSLSIFVPPPIDNSIQREYWVEFNPIAAISESGAIEFSIPGTSVDYINLSKTKLHIKYVITRENGDPIHDERGLNGQPTADSDQVGPVNFPLHSIFRQIDLSFNQKIVSPDIGVNYPYKALMDILLTSNNEMIESQGYAALFLKDQPGEMDSNTYIGSNTAFTERARPTKDGGTASIEGCLYIDFGKDKKRSILNGVSVNLKFFQSSNDFRLLRPGAENYKLKITSAIIKVCFVSLHPSVIVAHNEALKISPALYPFWRSDIKSFSVAGGSHTFMTDNIFHGQVPSKIIIGMVSNSAYSGDYEKNPFNFMNMGVNYLEINVDGQPVPSRPFRPNFDENDYVSSYLSLLDSDLDSKSGLIIKPTDYPDGYALYLFDIQSFLTGSVMSKSPRGRVRLSVRFSKALAETINIIVYAKFPEIMTIDQARNVNVS